MNAIVVLSGGQDSATCLLWALKKGYKVLAVTFAYAQRHEVEIACSRFICSKYGVKQRVIDISFFGSLSKSSSLTNDAMEIPDGKVEGVPSSFVPDRNQLFFTIAHSIAVNEGIDTIIMGVNQADYSGYPDCRKEFLDKLIEVTNLGSSANVKILYPLLNLTKAEIFALADELGHLNDIIELTHTCYKGEHQSLHEWGYGCGVCPSCEIRKNGFNEYKLQITERLS